MFGSIADLVGGYLARRTCTLAIQRAGGGGNTLGDSWMKNVLVVFDLKDNEIRIAARENY